MAPAKKQGAIQNLTLFMQNLRLPLSGICFGELNRCIFAIARLSS